MKIFFQTTAFKQAILASLVSILILLTVNSLTAQNITQKTSFEQTPEFTIQQFSGTPINGKIYFKFLILENLDNVNYILESSADGQVFHEIAIKEGVKSPNQQALLYCYVVETDQQSDKIFRIKRWENNKATYSLNLDFTGITSPILVVEK